MTLAFDPSFVDFDAYADAVYSPPPQLVALGEVDPFWRTLGGSTTDPFGCGGETFRQRDLARAATSDRPRSADDGAPPIPTRPGGASPNSGGDA